MTLTGAKRYVKLLLGEEKAKLWWKLPNPQFGGLIPQDLIDRGRAIKVIKFIEVAKDENKPIDPKHD